MTAVATTDREVARLDALSRHQRSLWGDALRRLRRNRAAMAGLAVIAFFALAALCAPLVAPYDPIAVDTKVANMDPVWGDQRYVSAAHLFGTDSLGRDTLSRLLYSARISMVVGLVPTLIIFSIGVSIGMVAGYRGGAVDNLLMRFTDVMFAFPDLLFLIIIVATLRSTGLGDLMGGLVLIFVALSIVGWVGIARLTRGQVLSLREKEFVEAARATGATDLRIMFRHLLPNSLAPLIVTAAFAIPQAILAESTLGFIGIGIKPPTPTWGVMINDGFIVFAQSAWLVFLPAVCISLVMLAFTFLGDGIRDALDPRMTD